jgi:UDP-N-acetylglucosamine 2-epimerase (non-hydrolysing)
MSLPEIHLIGGTGPEAVKFAPVALAMRAAGLVSPVLVAVGRDPTTVTRALAPFGLDPDLTLQVDGGSGSRSELLTEMIRRLDALWAQRSPAAVLAYGGGTAGLAGALTASWRRIPVVHVEAGPRAGDFGSPSPEEADRRLIAQVAALHLAPTALAAMSLLDEDIATATVLVTGDTAVDAMLAVAGRRLPFEDPRIAAARATVAGRRLIVVTARRRESWGAPLDRIVAGVRRLVERYADLDVILSSDANPAVRAQVGAGLGGVERVTATGPLSYPDLARLLSEAYLVLTDSGGIQQEAPSFGLPTLVLRDVTERVEALHAGCTRLVGSDTDRIVEEAAALLDSKVRRDAMTAGGNPYGDGLAAVRTAQATAALLGLAPAPSPLPAGPSPAPTATFGAPF